MKRFFIKNEGDESLSATFGVYVQVEINGGVGDTGLSWHEIDKALLAINRGHGHSNRKLAPMPPSSSPWRWTTAARSSASRPGRTRPSCSAPSSSPPVRP